MISNTVALRIMRKLMDEHGLHNFHPQIVHCRGNVIGLCKYDSKLIAVDQKWLKTCSSEEFRQVVLHEIAHELDDRWYGGRGHGQTFRMACKRIGCVFDKPIIHHIGTLERGILVIVGAALKRVREVPFSFQIQSANMKIITKSQWKDYQSGKLSINEL